MSLNHIALIDDTGSIDPSIMAQTSAALQKQVSRDLGPIWNLEATIDYFPDIKSVPSGYWTVIIMEDIPSSAEGIHKTKNGQPYSIVINDDAWQLTCSHEVCEMLVDPFGDKLITADSIVSDQGRVNYIVEVCDPCGGAGFAYSVNGIPVCDFYTPQYFDPVTNPAVRYSFSGAITQPKQILQGGYLSWINPEDNKTYQANFFGTEIKIIEIINFNNTQGSLRGTIDYLTKNNYKKKLLSNYLTKHQQRLEKTIASTKYNGDQMLNEINPFRIKRKKN